MKYSLKNEYKYLLKESKKTIQPGTYRSWRGNNPNILVGRFSNEAKNLWNYKDGSGGRGEYSIVYDILKDNTDLFKPSSVQFKKVANFFDDLDSNKGYYFDLIKAISDNTYSYFDYKGNKINTDFNETSFKNFIAEWFEIKSDDILLVKGNNPGQDKNKFKNWDDWVEYVKTIPTTAILRIDPNKMSPIGTAVGNININQLTKAISKNCFLKLNANKTFKDEDFFQYSVLNSITTSGSESKSCDIIISNKLLNDSQKRVFKISDNEDLTIEVKEVKNWSDVSKQGIRLGGGSKLAAIAGDILFSINTIAIACDFNPSESLEGQETPDEIEDILYRIKNGEINVDRFDRMLDLMQNKEFIDRLSGLINSSNVTENRKDIANQCINLLKSKILYKQISSDVRSRLSSNEILKNIQEELKSIIENSINANWFCIALGQEKNKSYSSKGTYIMVHKSGYKNHLMNAKISGGGTGFARLYDAPDIDDLELFFTTESLEENRAYALRLFNKGIFDKSILKECFLNSNTVKKSLKEVYTNGFKKKLISEGGLAGHMMHPYEALDMTLRQIIDRIKEYSTTQSIIEKVDGQNLFFTVEEDGTLMFARNKEDMSHDDLVTKFTGHPAEKPFLEGGNAIKRGVEQWLSSAGPSDKMEIQEIFHPDGETRSFVNFEIMHPDKPNQIIYDQKYIVFHSIVDFVDGRESTYSSNNSERLNKLMRLMKQGIESSGFTLASNRTVNLNTLTNTQIEDYIERIKEVGIQLNIDENEYLGDGIEKNIKEEIDSLGITISDKDLKTLYNFVIYGEDRQGNNIKSKDFTTGMSKSDIAGLRSLDLTSANKALKKVQNILSPFKEIFVDLGIDLLKGVKSSYMSDETNQKNIELLRDKLQTAMNDLINYMNEKPENYWEPEVHRLRPYLDKVIDTDITDIVSTAVEGGVYDYQGDLLKVTGGFAPLNQILGAAYRDKKGIFPTFKEKFMKQESNRRSLKSVFNLIY